MNDFAFGFKLGALTVMFVVVSAAVLFCYNF
jgi:hypothetical protein